MMEQVTINQNLVEVTKAIASRFNGDVVVEAGIELLHALIELGAIDELALSISPVAGDGDFINVEDLLSRFFIEHEIIEDDTRLLKCRYQGNSADR